MKMMMKKLIEALKSDQSVGRMRMVAMILMCFVQLILLIKVQCRGPLTYDCSIGANVGIESNLIVSELKISFHS